MSVDPLADDDVAALHALVAEHRDRTGSPVAARVLDGWERMLPMFVKVMPHDYKRALAELARDGVHYQDDHPVSSGGEGFVTTETETEAPAAA